MNFPTKPVESATVYFAGDQSAGIHDHSFDVEMWIDPSCFGESKEFETFLEEIRIKLKEVYEFIHGEPPSWVRFDFEAESY